MHPSKRSCLSICVSHDVLRSALQPHSACCAVGGNAEYDAFAAAHGRRHASPAEYQHRLGVFQANSQLVEAHNKAGRRNFTLALNRFADWTQARAGMRPFSSSVL